MCVCVLQSHVIPVWVVITKVSLAGVGGCIRLFWNELLSEQQKTSKLQKTSNKNSDLPPGNRYHISSELKRSQLLWEMQELCYYHSSFADPNILLYLVVLLLAAKKKSPDPQEGSDRWRHKNRNVIIEDKRWLILLGNQSQLQNGKVRSLKQTAKREVNGVMAKIWTLRGRAGQIIKINPSILHNRYQGQRGGYTLDESLRLMWGDNFWLWLRKNLLSKEERMRKQPVNALKHKKITKCSQTLQTNKNY